MSASNLFRLCFLFVGMHSTGHCPEFDFNIVLFFIWNVLWRLLHWKSCYFIGYNHVTRIPKGATNVDIRQYSPINTKDDDTYLGSFYHKSFGVSTFHIFQAFFNEWKTLTNSEKLICEKCILKVWMHKVVQNESICIFISLVAVKLVSSTVLISGAVQSHLQYSITNDYMVHFAVAVNCWEDQSLKRCTMTYERWWHTYERHTYDIWKMTFIHSFIQKFI